MAKEPKQTLVFAGAEMPQKVDSSVLNSLIKSLFESGASISYQFNGDRSAYQQMKITFLQSEAVTRKQVTDILSAHAPEKSDIEKINEARQKREDNRQYKDDLKNIIEGLRTRLDAIEGLNLAQALTDIQSSLDDIDQRLQVLKPPIE